MRKFSGVIIGILIVLNIWVCVKIIRLFIR